MTTLHAYILRELSKTFLLTLIAVTGLMTMGGGMYNVIRFEGVTAADVLRALPILIPTIVTFTMPFAALFAATLVYGRLAADNELTACRAAGINIHRLFLSVILLALFVSLATIYLANYVFPDMTRTLEKMARSNVRDMAYQQLRQRGYVRKGEDKSDRYLLTSQAVQQVADDALIERGFEPPGEGVSYFWIESPTFLWVDEKGDLRQFAVADGGLCQFDSRGNDVYATIYITNGRNYEVGKSSLNIGEQKLGPIRLPIPIPFKPSMADLNRLMFWKSRPEEFPTQREKVEEYLQRLRQYVYQTRMSERATAGESIELRHNDGRRFLVAAAGVNLSGRTPALTGVTMRLIHPDGFERRITAPIARVIARSVDGVELQLAESPEAPILDHSVQGAPEPRRLGAQFYDSLHLPPELTEGTDFTPAMVIDPKVELPGNEALADSRASLQKSVRQLKSKVSSIIHFRLGAASSSIATILMGAILGIIFRGSRALMAVLLGCIPLFSLLSIMYMGRTLTERPATELLGPVIIWGALAAMLAINLVLMRVAVRR